MMHLVELTERSSSIRECSYEWFSFLQPLHRLTLKKKKSETGFGSNDFNLKYYKTGLYPNNIPFFKKKKTGLGENDFTFNVVLPHDDLTMFRKKKLNEPYFTN